MKYEEWKNKAEELEQNGHKVGIDLSIEEYCWQTGNYMSDCDCEFCFHKSECSGSDWEEN